MPAFLLNNFRKVRRAARGQHHPAPAPPEPEKPASPASFFSPGSPDSPLLEIAPPLLEIAPPLPNTLPLYDTKSTLSLSTSDSPPSDGSVIQLKAPPPRPPRDATPPLKLELEFDSMFSVSELWLARASKVDLAEKSSEGAKQEVDSYAMLQPTLARTHHTNPSQTSVVSTAPSAKPSTSTAHSTPSRRPAPTPIQIPSSFRPPGQILLSNPSHLSSQPTSTAVSLPTAEQERERERKKEKPHDRDRPKSRTGAPSAFKKPIKGTMCGGTPGAGSYFVSPHHSRHSIKSIRSIRSVKSVKSVKSSKSHPHGGGASSVHSSAAFPEILEGMFILPPERTSESFFGHAKQDSAILPADTPGHRIPSLYKERDSGGERRRSMGRRKSLPVLSSPIARAEEERGGGVRRPASALSPSKSPLEALLLEEVVKGRPESKALPPIPPLPTPEYREFLVHVNPPETTEGETSAPSTGPEGTSSAPSTAPTSASLFEGMLSSLDVTPPLMETTSSEDMRSLKEMIFTASELRSFLEPSRTPSPMFAVHSAVVPPLSPRTSLDHRRRSVDVAASSRPASKSSKTASFVLPIGISDPVSRKRASVGVVPLSPELGGKEREKRLGGALYGQIPPSALTAVEKRDSRPRPPPLVPKAGTAGVFSSARSPLRRNAHARTTSAESTDFPSPRLVLGTATKLDSNAFPQTPKPWSSPESSPQLSPPPVPAMPLPALPRTPESTQHSFLLLGPASIGRDVSSRRTSTMGSVTGSGRKPTRTRPALPIGPRKAPSRLPLGVTPQPNPAFPNSALKSSNSRTFAPGSAGRPRTRSRPQTPTFATPPVAWRGLTLEAAQWTYTSDQLQEIVGRAIRSGTDTSSIRLLNPETLDTELPEEEERLETKRDQLKSKFRTNSRRRRFLLRELELATDPASVRRLAGELVDENTVSDQLADDLYAVNDQLAQLTRLRDAHSSSALSMALRKLNTSLIRTKTELFETQNKAAQLEAERDEAWTVAEGVEQQLNDLRQQLDEMNRPKSELPPDGEGAPLSRSSSTRSSRVSAARKASLRASKASLRLSTGRSKSMRSSVSSVKYASIVWPHSPTRQTEDIPPVPPVPQKSASFAHPSLDLESSASSNSRGTSSVSTSYAQAKREVYEMLGLEPVPTPRLLRRAQSMSSMQTMSGALTGSFTATVSESPAESTVGQLPSPLVKSWSVNFKGHPRRSFSINGPFFMIPQKLTEEVQDAANTPVTDEPYATPAESPIVGPDGDASDETHA